MTGRTVTTSGSLQLDLTRLVDAIVQGVLAGLLADRNGETYMPDLNRHDLPRYGAHAGKDDIDGEPL
jgi:hypothetical protein